MTQPNRLAHEKSPYLLQHQFNPVGWYPWGDEAFAAARAQARPIFLSIGYSTCYWCHVMERDSFETNEVAELLNAHFIPVKVDREERPDVDQVYMAAVTALTGHGGWPLSVFLTPDRQPFWGGTFFYRTQFMEILRRIHEVWLSDRPRVTSSAEYLAGALRGRGEREVLEGGPSLDRRIFPAARARLSERFDEEWGGFGPAPKFPPTAQLGLLLRLNFRGADPEGVRMVERTLEGMLRGGIFDHLGGGFARYSTDAMWRVPHFEKMLYDNALLATSCLEAFQVTGGGLYAEGARATFDYIAAKMTGPEGGFYSAEDAGEPGEEGAYYVWRADEVAALLSPAEYARFAEVFGVTAGGNFEHGRTVLSLQPGIPWIARHESLILSARAKLLAAREHRPRPHLDDKVLAGWNGLMIGALSLGYRVLGEERYLRSAERSAAFIRATLMRPDRLLRRYRDGEAAIDGMLEDYVYLIAGLLSLYESTFESAWLLMARDLQRLQDAALWDESLGAWRSSRAPELPDQPPEFTDGATPAPEGVGVLNLLRLHGYFGEEGLMVRARQILARGAAEVQQVPHYASTMLTAIDLIVNSSREVAVVTGSRGGEVEPFITRLRRSFLPDVVAVAVGSARQEVPLLATRGAPGERAVVYICTNQVCTVPLGLEAAAEKLKLAAADTSA